MGDTGARLALTPALVPAIAVLEIIACPYALGLVITLSIKAGTQTALSRPKCRPITKAAEIRRLQVEAPASAS